MQLSARNALQHWRQEQLLSDAQLTVLSASLDRIEQPAESARAVRIFGFIGAVLTGLGAILFVASNWATMSPMQRTAVLLIAYAVSVASAVGTERRGLPLIGEALWLLTTLVLGANIFLIAQSYNLSLTLWQGTLAWTLGALALGYARQSAPQAAVAVPLAILTIGWAGGGSAWFFDDQAEFLFSDAGLRALLPLMGLALVGLSTLVERRPDLRFARVPCFRGGTLLLATTLIITTAHVELASGFFAADFTIRQVAIALAAAVVALAAATVGVTQARASRPAMLALLVALVALLVPFRGEPWVGGEIGGLHLPFALYVIAVFATALFCIWLGIRARNPRLVNLGMVSTTLLIVIQYFGWSFELLDRSLAFVLGGVMLMALSMFVERKRRMILARIAA